MKCISVNRKLAAYIDEELPQDTRAELEKHLKECNRCRNKYDKMKELDESVQAVYRECELPEGFEKNLVRDISENLDRKRKLEDKHDINTKAKVTKNRRIHRFITAAAVTFIVLFLVGGESLVQLLQNSVKGHPAFMLDYKVFKNIKEAQDYVTEIPFVPPAYVPDGYKLKEIEYTKNKDMSISLQFSYESENYNEIVINYTLKGEEDIYGDTVIINPEDIKVETDSGYSPPKGVKISRENTGSELTQKHLEIDLDQYAFSVRINYNYKISDSDKSEDAELIKIAEPYLSSSICNISEKSVEEQMYGKQIYHSFGELKNNVPAVVPVYAPSYIPEGFKLKDITYRMVNPDINFFIIDAIYERFDKSVLFIDYRTPSKGGVHQNNTGRIQTNQAYLLKAREDGKGELLPITEKNLPSMDSSFDINIYLSYDEAISDLAQTADSEIRKVLKGTK
ncbi:MAG: zf-HC2 domain-containing protein [Bacillota bacterium]|nr:zf-HC2 domain-containing protein [Bacillota bacterium]